MNVRASALGVIFVLVPLAAVVVPACSDNGAVEDEAPPVEQPKVDAAVEATVDVVVETSKKETGKCDPKDCAGLAGFVAGCCKDDGSCGYDGSLLGQGCVDIGDLTGLLDGGLGEGGAADGGGDCPSISVAGFSVTGCCLGTGTCGYVNPLGGGSCVDPASLPIQIPDAGPPKACGGGSGEGGSEASTDAPVEATTEAATGDAAVEAADDAAGDAPAATDAAAEAADDGAATGDAAAD